MGALQELTHLLPDSVWLNAVQINDVQVYFMGQAEAAAGLLQTLSQSAYFEQPQFQSAVSKNAEGKEVFQIRMRLRDVPLRATALPPAAPQPMATGAPRAGAGIAPGRPPDNAVMPPAAAPAKPNGAAAAKPTTTPKGDR
jgi:hypothetical protein